MNKKMNNHPFRLHSFDFGSVHESGTSYNDPLKLIVNKLPISTNMGPNFGSVNYELFRPKKSDHSSPWKVIDLGLIKEGLNKKYPLTFLAPGSRHPPPEMPRYNKRNMWCNEACAKFYVAGTVFAFEHLHGRKLLRSDWMEMWAPGKMGPQTSPKSPLQKKGIPPQTVGETSGVSSRGMWVGS